MPEHPPPTDKQRLSKALANTYNTTADTSPWELCQQYQAFLEYSAEHPDAGRYKIAHNMLDDETVPQGRVRGWKDGGMPDAMRGIQAAERHDWLDLGWDTVTMHNIAILVAWVYSGGSINSHYVPYLTVDDDESEQCAYDLLRALNEQPETVRDDQQGRATEVRPTKDAPPLGRLLTVLGAPQGPKNNECDIQLSSWLSDAPDHIQLAFARTYVWNRATERLDRPDTPIQITEQRPQTYLTALRDFFEDVTGERPQGQQRSMVFSRDAATMLNQPPSIQT